MSGDEGNFWCEVLGPKQSIKIRVLKVSSLWRWLIAVEVVSGWLAVWLRDAPQTNTLALLEADLLQTTSWPSSTTTTLTRKGLLLVKQEIYKTILRESEAQFIRSLSGVNTYCTKAYLSTNAITITSRLKYKSFIEKGEVQFIRFLSRVYTYCTKHYLSTNTITIMSRLIFPCAIHEAATATHNFRITC